MDESVGAPPSRPDPAELPASAGWRGRVRAAVLGLLAGGCIAASVPPWGWWPLAIVGVALLDRLLVIDIPPLDEETRMMIARDLFDQANRDNNGAFALPGDDVLAAIAKMGLRDAKRAILFAMGRAVRDDRLALTTADVDASCRVIEENRETRAKIGFAAKI